MTHQMMNLCISAVFRCVEGHLMRQSGAPQNRKMGRREMNSKMVVVVVGPSLNENSLRSLDGMNSPLVIGF